MARKTNREMVITAAALFLGSYVAMGAAAFLLDIHIVVAGQPMQSIGIGAFAALLAIGFVLGFYRCRHVEADRLREREAILRRLKGESHV